jgi:hypothetical protein
VLTEGSTLQALESQVQALQDENAVWESKYAELFRSQEMRSGPLLLNPSAEDVDAVSRVSLCCCLRPNDEATGKPCTGNYRVINHPRLGKPNSGSAR